MLTSGRQGARLHNIGQIKVTSTLNISEVQEEALEGWQWEMGLSRVTSESVSGASFHLHKVHAPRFTSVKGDATISWKLPALQLYGSLCLPLSHTLEHVLDSLCLHFVRRPLSPLLTKARLWSWVDLTLTMCLSQSLL